MRILVILVLAALGAIGATRDAAAFLVVKQVKLANGAITVKGKGALPFADIVWEYSDVAVATKNGTFAFTTTILPQRLPTACLADGQLSGGQETIDVLVPLCGSVGTSSSGKAGGFDVVDTTGRVVGTYTGLLFTGPFVSPNAVLGQGGLPVAFAILGDGSLVGSSGTGVFYESGDCTGPALIRVFGNAVVAQSAVVGTLLYYTTATGSSITYHSANTGQGCSVASSQTLTLAPTNGSVDLSTFVAPFHVSVR